MKRPLFLLIASIYLFISPLFSQKAKTAAIRMVDGAPALFVDGKPELPFFYALTHVSGGRWSWEELPAHNLRNNCADGIRLFQADLWLEDIWQPDRKQLDLDLARRQLRGVLDACPDAGVVLRLHVNAPMWWNRAHPDECVQYADGPVEAFPEGLPYNHEDGDIYRSLRASLASERWRQEAGARLAEFCRRLSGTPEGRSVIGMHISGGVYGEWHPFGFFRHEPDISGPMQQAFRTWLKQKYGADTALQQAWRNPELTIAKATVPDTALRRCCNGGATFRDPEQEQQVLDFYRCQQEVITADIDHFCRIVKENWGRPLITGVFYGYFHFGLCRQAMGGHLEVERILNSPWVDYLAGPPGYLKICRQAGGSGLQRSMVRSVRLHGKLWMDEVDNGYLQDKRERDFVRSDQLGDTSYLPILQRSLWLPLVQGCGLWLYDFGPRRNTGWWDAPLYREEIRRTREYFARMPRAGAGPAAEVLVIWDTDSYYYTANAVAKTCKEDLDATADALLRCGVPSDHYFMFDLQRLDLKAYRAVFFPNAWKLSPEKRRFIRDSIATGGRTIVWNFLPGMLDGRQRNKTLTEELTGLPLQEIPAPDTLHWETGIYSFHNPDKVAPLLIPVDPDATMLGYLSGTDYPVLVQKEYADYKLVYSAVPLDQSDVFRQIFRDAGCTVINEKNDLTFPGNGLLLLHTNEPGERSLDLGGEKKIDLLLPAPATRLLDARTGEIRL